MPDDARKLAIVIGVAGSVPRKYLAGAINGARDFERWAKGQGYETTLVTDSPDPVTMAVLREKIERLLHASAAPIYRIIVYFAGHGLIREIEEGLWLLSDWQNELRAVAVEVLKRRLSMYGPKQLCIISDACRNLPANVVQADLVPDAVLGAGPNPADFSVALDKFIAAQDGEQAFMIPGASPAEDRCVFSGVLIEGLWGQLGLTVSPFSKLEPTKITGRSLGAYLAAEAPLRARSYGLTLTPTISAAFPEGYDEYFQKVDGIVPPTFPPWPTEGTFAGLSVAAEVEVPELTSDGDSSPSIDRGLGGADTFGFLDRPPTLREHGNRLGFRPLDWRHGDHGPPPQQRVGRESKSAESKPENGKPLSAVEQLRAIKVPVLRGTGVSGVAADGGEVVRLWARDAKSSRNMDDAWMVTEPRERSLKYAKPMLLEFADGLFGSTVALPGLFTALVRGGYGVVGMLYRPVYGTLAIESPEATEAALDALERGTLRADAARDMATALRVGKHADPILGVITAYLYDAIGDVDNIRRMASCYAQCGQAIPYDIALLGGLTMSERTKRGYKVQVPEIEARKAITDFENAHSWTHCGMVARSGVVAGWWPWMRQGWTYLDHPTDVESALIRPGLVELRAGLMRSRFTTFQKETGPAVAEMFGMKAL